MSHLVLFTSLYFALGAIVGQLHLLRCPTCASKFGDFPTHAKYIAASALVALPMTVFGFLEYWFSPCEE